MDYDNFDDLFNDLKETVENPVLNTLGEVGKEVIKETTDEIVYHSEFQPYTYLRRYEMGGYGDEDNIHIRKIGDGLLELTNDTLANGDQSGERLDEIIEYGKNYNWRRQPPPRPVFEIVKQKLSNEFLTDVVKQKLKEIGYKTE